MIKYNVQVLKAFTFLKAKENRGHFKKSNAPLQLCFITTGKGEAIIGDKKFHPKYGDCFLFDGNTKVEFKSDKKDPFIPLLVHFKSLDKRKFSFYYKCFDEPFFFLEILNRILSAFQKKDKLSANNWLNIALMELLGNTNEIEVSNGIAFEYKSEIDLIFNKIKRNPERKWEINKIAHDMSLSREHFYKLFKKIIKCSPQQFITKSKMEKAKSLLKFSAYAITDISDLLGYSYNSQFSRDFKKYYGITPLKFREKSSDES